MQKLPVKEKRVKLEVFRKTQVLVMEVRREAFDGHVYSQIRDLSRDLLDWDDDLPSTHIVIDRQKGRGLDSDAVVHRAEALADLLGIPCEINLAWPCAAERGLPCRCPKCVDTTLRRKS